MVKDEYLFDASLNLQSGSRSPERKKFPEDKKLSEDKRQVEGENFHQLMSGVKQFPKTPKPPIRQVGQV